MTDYRDSAAYKRSQRMRIDEDRPVWPLTARDIPSLAMASPRAVALRAEPEVSALKGFHPYRIGE